MGGEQVLQSVDHRRVARMTGLGRVGGGQQAPAQGVEVQMLHVRQLYPAAQAGAEPGLHGGIVLVALGHSGVVGAVVQQQLFVADQERAGIEQARVPVDQCLATGAQDALPLGAHRHGVEPMEGLRNADQIDAGVLQAGGLGTAIDSGKVRILRRQPLFGGGAHGSVGLDRHQRMTAGEKRAAGDAGAGADVGDTGLVADAHRAVQPVQQCGRVVGPVADVVGDAAAEAFSAVGGGHGVSSTPPPAMPGRRRTG